MASKTLRLRVADFHISDDALFARNQYPITGANRTLSSQLESVWDKVNDAKGVLQRLERRIDRSEKAEHADDLMKSEKEWNIPKAFEAETKQVLESLERRCQSFSQQQIAFVTALGRCRKQSSTPYSKISTIAQVQCYLEDFADYAMDKTIFAKFLSLVHDLVQFRRTLEKVVKTKNDDRLNHLFHKWNKILQPQQNISRLRAGFPHGQVNHLSCDEARNHFGGIVSVIPVALDCAKEIVDRIESTKAYRADTAARGKMYSEMFGIDLPTSPYRVQASSGPNSVRAVDGGDADFRGHRAKLEFSTISSPARSITPSAAVTPLEHEAQASDMSPISNKLLPSSSETTMHKLVWNRKHAISRPKWRP